MFGGIVKRDRAVEMCTALHELARTQQGGPGKTMPYHPRGDDLLLLRGR
jgi:hypothetical protein